MATFPPLRRPLASRSLQGHSNPSPAKQVRIVSASKRPRSPDLPEAQATHKRIRSAAIKPNVPTTRDLTKEQRIAEREQKEEEFRRKYSRSFPLWTFYLDIDNIDPNLVQSFKSRLRHLGANIDLFYSSSVTHIIADGPTPSYVAADKENDKSFVADRSVRGLRSPFKPMPARGREEATVPESLKIWSTAKLDSVLSRCLPSHSTAKTVSAARPPQPPQHNLARLLQNEKVNGTTECDPNQKRHGFHYFSRGVCFVLLEDMRQELATIAAHEYPVIKDKNAKMPWPKLYCHPNSRNPFAPFDDREKRRWERMQQAEEAEEAERARRKKSQMRQFEALKRKVETRNHVNKVCDLRRSVSLNNLHRQLTQPNGEVLHVHCIDRDADDSVDSVNASGYQASGAGMGYMAASGNSVSITSTTGTTSTSGYSLRNVPLPAPIAERMKQQVTTSRKFPIKAEQGVKAGIMGPPSKVPTKQQALKRSKSTNTLRLSKREEGVKPGYCESCRLKFSDFSTHVDSKKHRKFASNPSNFEALDDVLTQLQRRTLAEVQVEQQSRTQRLYEHCVVLHSEHLNSADASRQCQMLSSPS